MPQNGPISPETARNGPKRPKPVRIRTRSQPRQGVSSLNQSAIAASAKPKRRADDGSGIDDARDPAPTPAPGPAARAVSGPTSHASIRGFWSRPVFIWFLSGVHPDDRVLFGCIARGSDGTSSWRSPPCIHRIGTPNRSGTIFDRTARAGATHHTEPCIRAAARPLSRDAPTWRLLHASRRVPDLVSSQFNVSRDAAWGVRSAGSVHRQRPPPDAGTGEIRRPHGTRSRDLRLPTSGRLTIQRMIRIGLQG
jgi:hypothetical protein